MNNFEITIDRIEGEKIVVHTSNNETIVLPISLFPKDIKEGEVFHLSLKNLKEKDKEQKEQARDILNEILDTSE